MFEVPLHLMQPSWGRGEVSPFLFGRVDLAGWAQGLRTLRNFTVRPEGAVMNRQGFNYIGNSITPTPRGTILIPFIFSATQSYVLEVGAGTAQAFSQGSPVEVATPSAINAGGFQAIFHGILIYFQTTTPHGLSVGNNITIAGVQGTGAFALCNGPATVQLIISSTIFCIPQNAAGVTGTYSSGGTVSSQATFATPWASADLPLVRWSQSADTLTVVHPNYPPYEIKRTSATSFTCLAAVYNLGPFLQQNADGVTFVYASAKSGTVTLTATSAIFNANHVGALFQLTQQDLSAIVPWEPGKQFAGNIAGTPSTAYGQFCRSNLKNYLSVSSVTALTGSNEVCTGTIPPSHSEGVAADGNGYNIPNLGYAGINWEYQDSGYGVVLITAYVSPTQVTAVVQPNYPGGPGLMPLACVGGPVTVVGPFTFNGTGSATSFGPLTGNTSTDPSKYYVTIGGVYQPPATYSISATGGGNIVFLVAPPAGSSNIVVEQISSLGQTTYWAFGAFSVDQGYPSAVSYFPDRLVLAATPKQPVGVFGSVTSQYHQFSVSNPVVASDAFTVFLNARQLNAISDLLPLSDLLVGTSNIIWRLWAGSTGTALGPLSISATPQNYYGESPKCAGLLFGDSAIFAEFDGRRLRDLIYQFAFDKFMGQEITLYSRHLIPYGKYFQRLAYKQDPAGQLVFGLRSDGTLLVCTYLREQQIIGWAHWDTQGTFEDICVVPETLPNGTLGYTLYAIVNRSIAGVTARYIERLAVREVATLYDYQFSDCNLTYDGRNTSSVSMTLTGGTTWLAGDVGTVNASTAAGWVNFTATDVTNANEIWLLQTLTFQTSVAGALSGTLTAAVAAGTYIVTFSDGECRPVTVDSTGVGCTWPSNLSTAVPITTGTVRCRLKITSYTSGTQVGVTLRDPCPGGLQGAATTTWTFARTTFSGAIQIAGMAAVALVDGQVYGIKSTETIADGTLTVGPDGTVTLPYAGGTVQLGLSYLCDFETLPLNVPGQETIRERAKSEPVIHLDVTETRNFLAGTSLDLNMQPNKARAFEPYTTQMAMQEGVLWSRVLSTLDSECHTCIRQNMPLPLSIRGNIPAVNIGEPIS